MEWISVKDQLPEENKMVLTANNWGWDTLNLMAYSDKNWYFEYGNNYDPQEGITHWMPLQKPPEND